MSFKTSCIASHVHYNNASCIFDVCLLCCYVVCWQDWIGLSLLCIYICMSHVHAFSCIRTFNSLYFDIHCVVGTFLIVFRSPSISLSYVSCFMAPNANLLRPRTLCILGHPLPLILQLLLFGSVMREPIRTSQRTFLDKAFIQNAESFCLISLTLLFPLSFTIGVGSHFVAPRSLVPP